ncbi:acyltransferase family protein [Streptomyces johnsoniae]|uniref:Acyltransferase family protein n=1 Tax=Streptomyces johnsoniae TaxID=3075532 RepID=A0ABU2RYK3_9ACTN|nr:acyltransferase family protein [Streptomyces sp. DSM 41886]MDT0441274.1 acyltransferase family protein [Streptomyces sp. DSM 41886]
MDDARDGRPGRNHYADLLRVGAIAAVVTGHWLLTDITYRDGRLSGRDALDHVDWGSWVTLVLQVLPVFFLVGGYVNAVSWTSHLRRGVPWHVWVQGRALGLMWPTAVYVAVALLGVLAAASAGAPAPDLDRGGWLVALHLWFLPLYLLMIVLTPLMLAAHRRWGLAVPAAMAALAGGVDVAVVDAGLPWIGTLNYLLVWGTMHQWGFAWQDGRLVRPRWRSAALAVAGAVLLVVLLWPGPFPVAMIGADTRVDNTSPPSTALLALAAAQAGLLLTAGPALSSRLERPARLRRLGRLNGAVMTVYLWHMAPVVLVAVTLYPAGIAPQPDIGSAPWLALRVGWVALLAFVLAPVTAAVLWAQRPLGRLPRGAGGAGRWWGPALLVCGVGAAAAALALLATEGFAPGGRAAVLAPALFAGGLAATFLSGARDRA